MAHHGWKVEDVLRLTPAQLLNAWASWHVEKIENRASAAWAARMANADKNGWKRAMKELDT